jgi:hypothetical protein
LLGKTTPIQDEQTPLADELKFYRRLPAESIDSNPLTFWQANTSSMPQLAAYAIKLLMQPATSVTVERMFSRAGHILTSNRTAMLESTIQNLFLCNANKGLLDWPEEFEPDEE